jgi:pseudouridylate synthase
MYRKLPPAYLISGEVAHALDAGLPLVALESAVVTHGLPEPENLRVAAELEDVVRGNGAIPATIAVMEGKIKVGLAWDELKELAGNSNLHKISVRELAPAVVQGWSGGTTVAGTMLAAYTAGIQIFATGGIGGVHRQAPFDVSADLPQLASTPMIVVCAGAKSILDISATLEYLETFSVPVVGYQTDEFPAFYSVVSGYQTSARADTPQEVVAIAREHWRLGNGKQSAILVATPPPAEDAIPSVEIEEAIQSAMQEAKRLKIRGQAVTPFLLERVGQISGGASLRANISLLCNNARVATEIAVQFASRPKRLMA